ncbi:MAG TPA: hypothetical protein VIZ43_06605 [Trebonia sp.]
MRFSSLAVAWRVRLISVTPDREQADGEILQRGHDLGAVSCVSAVLVLGECGVASPMHGLDARLAADNLRQAGGVGTVLAEAGDGVGDFLADQLPVSVVTVAAYPRDPADVPEGV